MGEYFPMLLAAGGAERGAAVGRRGAGYTCSPEGLQLSGWLKAGDIALWWGVVRLATGSPQISSTWITESLWAIRTYPPPCLWTCLGNTASQSPKESPDVVRGTSHQGIAEASFTYSRTPRCHLPW